MVFSSYIFIFVFFPVTLLGYHLLRLTRKTVLVKLWLVVASLVFYGVGQPDFLLGFILSMVLNYLILCGLRRFQRPLCRRLLLLAAVLWNIGLLVWFKYTNFILQNLNRVFHSDFPLLSLILPIGISFFTFQILAFTVRFYGGNCDFPNPLDYAMFVTFFPQLIVGPVVKEEELMPQVAGDSLLSFDSTYIYKGVMLFSIGCAKKVLLANPMVDFASGFYGGNVANASFVETWFAVLAYVFAYYFDFSGYIDMARGLGCFFGVELPVNFDSPYKARDFADFWRRWNMTISRFFNETVFANLFHFGDGIWKLIFATLATFAVSGLWHGAAWHYIIWGVVNGVFVCVANIRVLRESKPLPAWLAVFLTFFFGTLIRVLFDSNNMTQALQVYRIMLDPRSLFHIRTFLNSLAAFAGGHLQLVAVMVISALICFCAPNSNRVMEKKTFTFRDAALSAGLLGLSLFHMTQVSTFLYFNF